ncbi:MAG: YqgE/AlgH family protein, partial [Candidatus Neomarinimicrobiota bacterium]|nr:YqgE/AlgH family protein [Candidatus Neomarinimicrobiota bacterium]
MKTLLNQIIIAMPHMQDERFSKSVIFICEHNSYGAIGLIINKRIEKNLSLKIISELNKKIDFIVNSDVSLYFG